MTLEQLQTKRDELLKIVDGGLLEVRFGERWIKYQHLADMRQRLSDLDNQIAAASNGGAPRSMSNFTEFNG